MGDGMRLPQSILDHVQRVGRWMKIDKWNPCVVVAVITSGSICFVAGYESAAWRIPNEVIIRATTVKCMVTISKGKRSTILNKTCE